MGTAAMSAADVRPMQNELDDARECWELLRQVPLELDDEESCSRRSRGSTFASFK